MRMASREPGRLAMSCLPRYGCTCCRSPLEICLNRTQQCCNWVDGSERKREPVLRAGPVTRYRNPALIFASTADPGHNAASLRRFSGVMLVLSAASKSAAPGSMEDREFKRCFPAPWPGFVRQRRPVGQRSESAAARFSIAEVAAKVHRRGRLRVNPQNQGAFACLRKPRAQPAPLSRGAGRLDGDRRAAIRRRAPPEAHAPGSAAAPGPAGRGV